MSIKPDDIPQSVWDTAEEVAVIYGKGLGALTLKVNIARAILTAKAEEREGCARVADEEERKRLANMRSARDGSAEWGNPQEAALAQGHKAITAKSIADAIRQRGET